MDIDTIEMEKSKIMQIYSIRKNIDLEPPYQRNGGLWELDKKQKFLDSIFNGYDVPKLYFHHLVYLNKNSGKISSYSIIDGRQRLETLWEFINNEFPLGNFMISRLKVPTNLNGIFYRDLAKNYLSLKSFLDNYKLPIMSVELNDEKKVDLINELFLRLNSGVTLTSAEKRNAIGGKMASIIRKIAKHEFFKRCVAVTNKRYQHYEITARLLFLENSIQNHKIIDTKKKFLDQFVRDHKEKLPQNETIQMIETVLDIMMRVFSEKDKLLKRQAKIPIYYLLTRESKRQNKIRNITRDSLTKFNNRVEENKKLAKTSPRLTKPDLTDYDRYTIQGTNDAGSIKARFHIISKYFDIDSSEIDTLD